MANYFERLKNEHRRLNRVIDTCRAASRQHELKDLKRLRLIIKDKFFALQHSHQPSSP